MATAILRQYLAGNTPNPNRDAFGEGVRTGRLLRQNRREDERSALHEVIGRHLAAEQPEAARAAAYSGGDLRAGAAIDQRLAGRRQAVAQEREAFGQEFAQFAGNLLGLPEEQQEAVYRSQIPAFERKAASLGIDFESGPMDRDALRGIAARYGTLPKAQGDKGFTLSPDQRRYDAQGNLIAAAPAESERESQGETFKTEQGLRKEFTSRQKDYLEQERAWERIQAAAQNPSPAGDMALIFNFMKAMDPGSVVRESEFRTAALAGSFGDRIQAATQQIVSGKRLSDDQRADFLATARNIYQRSRRLAAQDVDFFRTLARQQGLDPDRVINPARGREEAGGGITLPDGRTISEEQIQQAMAEEGKSREEVIAEIRELTGG